MVCALLCQLRPCGLLDRLQLLLLQGLADGVPRADLRLHHGLFAAVVVLLALPGPYADELLHLALRLPAPFGGTEDQEPFLTTALSSEP